MKTRWAITVATTCGIAFLLVDLWHQKPLSTEVEISSVPKIDELQEVAAIDSLDFNLDDDTLLDDNSRKLESNFQRVLENKYMKKNQSQNKIPKLALASNVDSPWDILDASIVTDAVRLRKGVDPMQLIQINPEALQNLQVGDSFNLPPITEKQYSVVVTKNKTLWNGDSSIAGQIKTTDGDVFPVTILQGRMSMFASISTPKGSYEIEAFGDVGGLYSVAEIDQQTLYAETDELTN